MRYRLADHGAVFATRERGAEVRAQIEAALRQADERESLSLDFDGVELISFSVADEVVGRLLSDRAAGNLGERAIFVVNANEDVLDPITRSVERRGVVGAELTPVGIRLIGAPAHLQATFDEASRRGEFRTTNLAADLGISIAACNNRLKPLLEAGLLTRAPAIPRSGGREFVYRVTLAEGEHEREVA